MASFLRIDPDYHCPEHAPNQAARYQASGREQREAEETARFILGDALVQAPTVRIILESQGWGMDPLEWKAIRNVLEIDESAFTDIFRLCCLLPQPRKEGSVSRGNGVKKEADNTAATRASDGHLKRMEGWELQLNGKFKWES